MNFWQSFFLRVGIYILLAGLVAVIAWFRFFKEDTENVQIIGGSNGRYYLKFIEFNSTSDIQIKIVKILGKTTNDQTLIFEGGYKLNGTCNQTVASIEDLMNTIEYYREEQNKIYFRNQSCYLEKN